jgi:hypothetical protein
VGGGSRPPPSSCRVTLRITHGPASGVHRFGSRDRSRTPGSCRRGLSWFPGRIRAVRARPAREGQQPARAGRCRKRSRRRGLSALRSLRTLACQGRHSPIGDAGKLAVRSVSDRRSWQYLASLSRRPRMLGMLGWVMRSVRPVAALFLTGGVHFRV